MLNMNSRSIKSLISVCFIFSSYCSFGIPDDNFIDTAKDYLNVPGPINLDNTHYNLAWSSHPNSHYFKQEYIPTGDDIEHFSKMVFIDVLTDTFTLEEVVSLKIRQLENMKINNPVINYMLIQNADSTEYILDFVLSQGSPRVDLVEWNIYRYKIFVDNAGHKGVLLFANSIRSYGNAIRDFFGSLSATRKRMITILRKYEMPEVKIED
jgi:hypothetical protein